jgi:alkanesulfonate monooxygenase SsuD/methylene tetrahydromethanopterin reductase-like flavin-dependent oxidoreductase (luciferase family)
MRHMAENLDSLFTYHPPKGDQTERYQRIREAGKALAREIDACCPAGLERAEALANVRQAVMWANAGIACHE